VLEPFREYLEARLGDDAHVLAGVLHRELAGLGFQRSYQTLTRELRRLELRPRCECCRRGGVDVTTEIDHPPGEELQFDWLELPLTPWGEPAYVLVGALSHSGQCRGVFSDGQTGAHVIESLDEVLRRLGGTTMGPRRLTVHGGSDGDRALSRQPRDEDWARSASSRSHVLRLRLRQRISDLH